MKARWTMQCECCKERILIGSSFVMYRGRPWRPEHMRRYVQRRTAMKR